MYDNNGEYPDSALNKLIVGENGKDYIQDLTYEENEDKNGIRLFGIDTDGNFLSYKRGDTTDEYFATDSYFTEFSGGDPFACYATSYINQSSFFSEIASNHENYDEIRILPFIYFTNCYDVSNPIDDIRYIGWRCRGEDSRGVNKKYINDVNSSNKFTQIYDEDVELDPNQDNGWIYTDDTNERIYFDFRLAPEAVKQYFAVSKDEIEIFVRFNIDFALGSTSALKGGTNLIASNIYTMEYVKNQKADDLRIGTLGENYTGDFSDKNLTPVETIRYILSNYLTEATVDNSSFDTAQEQITTGYFQLPACARQLIESDTVLNHIETLLEESQLAMYLNPQRQMTVKYWLNDDVPVTTLNKTNIETISSLRKSGTDNIYTELDFMSDYREYNKEYNQQMRVYNSGASDFNQDTCTEGVESNNLAYARDTWFFLNSGYKRNTGKIVTTKNKIDDLEWFKELPNVDTSGSNGMLVMRNRMYWHTFEKEYTTIIISAKSASIPELWDKIYVDHPVVTYSTARIGWVYSIKELTNQAKIELKVIFDISVNDPYDVIPDILFDSIGVPDTIFNDPVATDIIFDGDGR